MKERHALKLHEQLHVPLRTIKFTLDLEKGEKDTGITTKEHNFVPRTLCVVWCCLCKEC